jgi:competence protein ComEC
MVLGEKAHIPKLVYNSMVRSGTVHILVVSGFNVGIVAGLVILVLKILRLGRKLRFVLAVFCLVFYCFLTGSSTPVVRATLMGEFFLFSALLKRESDIYNSLALAALFILAVNPRQLFDVGFQLSFASVFAIVFLYPRFSSLARPQALKARWLKAFACGGLVSFSAWIGTLGFIAYYFRIFAPVTILANIFIVPLAAFITLCGFSLVFAALIFPAGAPFFAATAELAVTCLLKINALLIRIPGAYLYL